MMLLCLTCIPSFAPEPTHTQKRLRVIMVTLSPKNSHYWRIQPSLKAFKVKRVGFVPGDNTCPDPIIQPINMVYALMSEIDAFQVRGFTHLSMNPRPKTGYIVVPP
eukprot:6181562-Pleurochrysis_carterae.AAC.1